MNESSFDDQIKIAKPTGPRARRPMRELDTNDQNKLFTVNHLQINQVPNIMQRPIQQRCHRLSNTWNDEDSSSNDDTTEEEISDHSSENEDLLLDSFKTTYGSPVIDKICNSYGRSPNRRAPSVAKDSPLLHRSPNNQIKKNAYDEHKSSNFIVIVIIVSIVLVILCIITREQQSPKELGNEKINEERIKKVKELDKMLDELMNKTRKKFSDQKPHIWNDISARIYDVILYPKKPSIITLLGNDINTLNCLAEILGEISGIILGSNEHLTLRPEDFESNHGEVIHSLKIKILEKKAVIIRDLLNISTEVIQAFHSFCDRENPLVGHAIYIITVVVDDYDTSQKELQFIEKQLRNRFGKIKKDILDPLIIRLTDGAIIPILPDSNVKSCSLF